MTPHTLEEFAQELRRKGNWREAEFASEILDLLDLEADIAEPYSTLCDDLEAYAKSGGYEHADKPEKAAEWLGDRSNLLAEIEQAFEEAGRTGDVDDIAKELIGTLDAAEDILEAAGWPGDGDFLDALQALADRAKPTEYDL